jgi:hypothetical protein
LIEVEENMAYRCNENQENESSERRRPDEGWQGSCREQGESEQGNRGSEEEGYGDQGSYGQPSSSQYPTQVARMSGSKQKSMTNSPSTATSMQRKSW